MTDATFNRKQSRGVAELDNLSTEAWECRVPCTIRCWLNVGEIYLPMILCCDPLDEILITKDEQNWEKKSRNEFLETGIYANLKNSVMLSLLRTWNFWGLLSEWMHRQKFKESKKSKFW